MRRLALLLCAAALVLPRSARSDTCSGLMLGALTPAGTGATTGPVAVATGDFNHDGKLDVATANGTGHSVSILAGDGMGGFGGPVPFAWSSSSPIDVVAGDIDRDGFLDLVVASGAGAQARILRGSGTGFIWQPAFSTGSIPSRLHLADFDRDGFLDLVVVSRTAERIHLFQGNGSFTFSTQLMAPIDVFGGGPPDMPSAAVSGDFNRDGYLDLAVTFEGSSQVGVYFRNSTTLVPFSMTSFPAPFITLTGTNPRDLAVGDVDRDGWLDIVTANHGTSANVTVLRNERGSPGTTFTSSATPVGGSPARVGLADLNHDGILDATVIDDSASRRVVGLLGLKTGPPWFEDTPIFPENLPGGPPGGLSLGGFTADGRIDMVTALGGDQVVVVQNLSGTPCSGTSFALAPRAYGAGDGTAATALDGPASTAAADFDLDGRPDLAVATETARKVRLLRNAGGHLKDFTPATAVDVSPNSPVSVATADLDSDGKPDVVAGLAGANVVRVFRGNGMGGLTPIGSDQTTGSNPVALVIGDFDGNGIPDVAAAAETSGFVYVFLGTGTGALNPGIQTGVGGGPRALVAGFFNGDAFLDLAVANAGSNNVTILLGQGNGSFTNAPGSPVAVGAAPWGIAAGDIDGDGDLDLATADNGASTASVLINLGGGAFSVGPTYTVPSNPTAVALVDLAGDVRPDLAVTSSGSRSLRVLRNDGAGTFSFLSDHALRNFPRAITTLDMDADGKLDLAVPCQNADSIVVLLARPPALQDAPRFMAGSGPFGVVAADLDGDGDLDLAVANRGDGTVTIHLNDGMGGFGPAPTATYPVGTFPATVDFNIVAADLNRDGRVDLAVNVPDSGAPAVAILLASGPPGNFAPAIAVGLAGPPVPVPDDLAVGDFDRDGDLDIAVCNKLSTGEVRILRNDGSGGFSAGPIVSAVGDQPTAIVAADFDRDGDLDLAVGNDAAAASNIRVLLNDGFGGFSLGVQLSLDGSDTGPLSVTAGDLDGDGLLEIVATSFTGDRVHVYRNAGSGVFSAAIPVIVPAVLEFVTLADVNRDGELDLAAAANGLVALRGKPGGVGFDPPETWVAGQLPKSAAIADFNRDGRLDAAVVNGGSNDVSVLLSSTCTARRLDVVQHPLACSLTGPLFVNEVIVEARDDGGNLAVCATGSAKPAITPGTGEPGADLTPDSLETGGLPLMSGVAAFTVANSNALFIDRPGRRYRLQFSLEDVPFPNLPLALTRSFTLGSSSIQIVGPSSICAPGLGSYNLLDPPDRWDSYTWTLDGQPLSFAPTALLQNPENPLVTLGLHNLNLTTRLDGCSAVAPTKQVYVGDLQSVSLDIQGISTVCVDCIGGTAKALETGGGSVTVRQWAYRPASAMPPYVDLPGETGETYTLKGASFPGPGNYFVVVRSTTACGGGTTATSNEWAVTVTDSVPSGEVKHLAASSRGTTASLGSNVLRWVNSTGTVDEVLIRWNKSTDGMNDCVPPPDRSAPATGQQPIPGPLPTIGSFPHGGLTFDTAYCYSVFVRVGLTWSAGRTVKARPFNAETGPVKWAYATGGTAVTPPTVSHPAILAMSNDRTVHALTRGNGGGDWPGGWVPTDLMGLAHSRSPVVPFTTPLTGSVLLAADDMGWLHAINATTGVRPWPAQGPTLSMTGAPAGLFLQYGGNRDLLLVGTRDTVMPNQLRALNVGDGTLAAAYSGAGSPGEIGPIHGMPAVDYATKRVYFAARSRLGGDTLFCVNVTDPPNPTIFTWEWSENPGNITGSPVLFGGRVYVGVDGPAGTIHSYRASDGLDPHVFTPTPSDGPVKGFLFPDRRTGSDDLIFATDTKVWSISDDGSTMTKNWEWTQPGLNPSVVLYRPGTDFVYVGSSGGKLYELDFSLADDMTPPTHKLIVLGGGEGQVGAPSLDIGVVPPLLVVGSEPGTLFGIPLPFP